VPSVPWRLVVSPSEGTAAMRREIESRQGVGRAVASLYKKRAVRCYQTASMYMSYMYIRGVKILTQCHTYVECTYLTH
jgi:hypothetical protein